MEQKNTRRGEPPIRVWGSILAGEKGAFAFRVRLPNGKVSWGHVPRVLAGGILPVAEDVEVLIEFSPFDLDRGRIVGKRDGPGVSNNSGEA